MDLSETERTVQRRCRSRFAREDHCSSTTSIRLNFRMARHPPAMGNLRNTFIWNPSRTVIGY